MISGSTALNATSAAALSPPETASSNLRIKVRTRVRRALLTSVRATILRTAFLDEGVLLFGGSVYL